ncbi:ergothioneine biosynthesis protein EgtB [Pedobacter sp. P351]|uniref:ergothioneine biosynthesis protein EgtB n=1 Tax=Pedobacter superstes TaxID=3133441 RepID=UPI00309D694B
MLLDKYKEVRALTEKICAPLKTEDYVVQPIADVSPPKWHLGHTSWFFETFILKPHLKEYKEFDLNYNFVFNSYYETVGNRVIRTDRGNLSRPAVEDIYAYRRHVDNHMHILLQDKDWIAKFSYLITLGLNHEQQHQELLYTDIKYIFGHNPLFPAYSQNQNPLPSSEEIKDFIEIPEGLYGIGYEGEGFSFDNESYRHTVYLNSYKIRSSLISNSEYLEFIKDGGYQNFNYWHLEGWEWVNQNHIKAPLYWHQINGAWHQYTLNGLNPIEMDAPLCHINYYEAHAYAEWAGKRLPTEFEWEAASAKFNWGKRWEWTESAYLPYPGFKKEEGALGEYNGKFMINQMVLRGASEVTSPGHSRATYRNFFHPDLRWQYTGIRLAQ